MKKLVLIHILFGLATSLQAQITLIPDPYFEGVLVGFGIDTDGEVNGQALTSDLEAVTQLLIFDQELITDVTGIEAFINLEKLELTNMGITHLDLTNATLLEELEVGNNSLLELDLSNNINLKNLIIQFNCASCQFYSPLNTLDLSNILLLNQLLIFDTEIINLDLSNNPDIGFIEITRNNSLNSINFKNGNNSQTFWLQFTDNPNLECVQVDDPAAVMAGTTPPYDNWVIENDPIISEDCFLGIEENKLKEFTIYPNPVIDILTIESFESITKVRFYDMFGRKLQEITSNLNEIPMANVPSGLMLVEIETEQGKVTQKIIKE